MAHATVRLEPWTKSSPLPSTRIRTHANLPHNLALIIRSPRVQPLPQRSLVANASSIFRTRASMSVGVETVFAFGGVMAMGLVRLGLGSCLRLRLAVGFASV